jgi:hypothetical protein
MTEIDLTTRNCIAFACPNDAEHDEWCDHCWRTMRREQRAAICASLAEDHGGEQAAKRLRIAYSTLRSYISDPDGSKDRARKDSYSGTCDNCGAKTDGSNGAANAPRLCLNCAIERQTDQRKWTRAVVIDAIQRFAQQHGRPPTASDWDHADPANGYPPKSAVYGRHSNTPSAPFDYWADAIEAAGFPRPEVGGYERTALVRERLSAGMRHKKGGAQMADTKRGYIVLHERPDGAWEIITTTGAQAENAALNEALNGSEPTGRYVAVPAKYFIPRGVVPQTVWTFEEAAVA